MTERSFTGRRVVVTGAASGIGAALVGHFSRAGARVALLDLDTEGAATVAGGLADAETMVQHCDVTSLPECE
ncbi:MAG: SDR family NAD(P)-dependent oxidoreductase, partial [Actinobacteria bacterium]|nr:SDR family NAD(P)-dependent oxidoreductase [Actinomycetota bacterium]NIS36245.1 SDR family NAD(P)-dependent oxidoreductase [Actinomycetota bacterium]NIT96447.1 SDR family NAD(P)-dependent oxidoreductase [Actinomycetota bacterium]NIU20148.1 SDR family NAD(P)-dependent oxidoreductase [Actinomycetota bacterium]NIU67761.1 SDR family NAD(P)-dependent oxidoreductase [Actinomycetota bacterium]